MLRTLALKTSLPALFVIPANAGIQLQFSLRLQAGPAAFAGVTISFGLTRRFAALASRAPYSLLPLWEKVARRLQASSRMRGKNSRG
jgi:hypothetical protein